MGSHNHVKCPKLCAFLTLLLFCVTAPPHALKAEEDSNHSSHSSALFMAGKEAFQKGLPEQALQNFLSARASGMVKPALYYNIGVCYYRLGEYEEAEKAFRKTAEYPDMASLAYYNLGLISLQQQERDAAIQRFQLAKSKTKNKKIHLMADAALQRLKGKKNKISWVQYASLGLGYDDNVALLADTENVQGSDTDDFFAELLGHISGYLGDKPGAHGTQFHANVYLLQYLEMDEYDIGSFSVGLVQKKTVNSMQLEGRVEYAYTVLDNHSFEQIPTISFQVKYPLRHSKSAVRFRYRLSYLDILNDDYDYLTGLRHQVRGESFWNWSVYRVRLAYILEMNDKDDQDYSPTRHTLKGTFSIRPSTVLKLSFGGNYRNSQYDMSNLTDRHEERLRGEIKCTFYLKKNWQLNGEYQYTDNDSNYEEYNYTRNMIIFSLSRSF